MTPQSGSAAPHHAPQEGDGRAQSAVAVEGPAVSSFERLTMPHLPVIARFARSLTRDAAAADDLVQETYLRALRGWHTFRDGSDARRWLFAICHHAFLRDVQRADVYVQPPDDDPELESLETAVAHWRAQQSGLADAAERLDLGQAINRAMGTLSPHYRTVVVLVDVEGQTYEEAAEVLGVPIGTVRSRLFRARRMLQDLLFDYARDAGFEVTHMPAAKEAIK
ncbi:MAG TPA: sigma-70 family RNA polymerase sigma factor [Gemmatimonadaceae bacterium]|nr:sigma-70 family RNA polymerase sigma factor [Gemmatimonadaceae bacterium]